MNDLVPAYRLSGLPDNLFEQHAANVAPPLYALLGFTNRESRKREMKVIRKFLGAPKTVTDDDVLSTYLGSQRPRLRVFWMIRRQFSPVGMEVTPEDCYEAFGKSITHSLLTLYAPYAFIARSPEEIDSILKEIEQSGVPIYEISEALERELGDSFDRNYLGFLSVWPKLVEDLGKFDCLSLQRRDSVANAVFALSAAMNTTAFMEKAAQICPMLEGYFYEFVAVGQGSAKAVDMKVDEEESGREDWASLVAELALLVDKMSNSSPSADLMDQLHNLVERMDQVPVVEPVSLDDVLARLQEVFSRYDNVENAGHFEAIRADIDQVFARWKMLALEASDERLVNLYDDLAVRPSEVKPHEEAYLRMSGELREALAACEQDQKNLALAPLARKGELRAALKNSESARDAIEEKQSEIIKSLCGALNYRGEPFDVNVDWIARAASAMAMELGASESSTQTDEADIEPPLPEPVETAPPTVALPIVADVTAESTATSVAAESVENTAAPQQPDVGKIEVEQVEASAGDAASPTSAPLGLPKAGDKTVTDHFWAMVAAGEYGLAHNLALLSGETPGMPSSSITRLLVLGTELAYPQGAIARALEEAVIQFDPQPEMEQLEGTDYLAANLLLVAATVRSGLLAPNTGANDLLNRGISLGAGWDSLHELTQIVSGAAHQMHGVFLGPDAFRQRKADKSIEASRQALKDAAESWLAAHAKSRLSFQPATAIWHDWVGRDGKVYQLLAPIFDPKAQTSPEWHDLLSRMADPDEVEVQVQERDRALRGNRFGNIDYKAMDQMQRRVAEAVDMVRQWMALQDAQPRTDYIDRNITDLDRSLEAIKPRVMAEIEAALERPENCMQAVSHCLKRELDQLYDLFAPESSFVTEERSPALALNGDLLLLPGVHLDSASQCESESDTLRVSLLAHQAGNHDPVVAAQTKMEEGDFEAAEWLIERANRLRHESAQSLSDVSGMRLTEARSALKALHAATTRKLEAGFRAGLISDAERDAMMSVLVDIEGRFKEVRRIDLARKALDDISDKVAASAASRMLELRERFTNLDLPTDDPRYIAILALIDKEDVLAAEEYIDHVGRGEAPPMREEAEDEPASFSQFIQSMPFPIGMDEIETAVRAGDNLGGLTFAGLSEDARQDALNLLNAWSSIKRLKSRKSGAEPQFDANAFSRLLVTIGFSLTGSAPVTMSGQGASRLDLMLKTTPLADRRICPVPEFGSEAKGVYRVVCVFPKANDLDVTEITPATRGTPVATIVLFMGQLSREGRQRLLRQSHQARRAWLVIDEFVLLYLMMQAQGRLRAMFKATLPFTVTDPYRIKQSGIVPPEMFFGRMLERESVISLQGASFVYGGRQLGKTVLLKEIERVLHNPAAASIVQWVDLPGHGVGRSCRPEALWTIVVRELYRYGVVSMDWPDFRATEAKHVFRITEDIRGWLDKHPDGRILLLLDEADEFLKEEAAEDYPVTRQLKALMERTGGRFKTVFVGLHNVLRSTRAPNNPLVHLGSVEIGPLYANGESRAAFDMVYRPFAAIGYSFADDSLIMRVLAACNYYPNLINHFCRKLLERLRSRADAASVDPCKGPIVITDRMVSETYEDAALRDDIRHYFLLTLELDTRYELIANWLAMEYLQKHINSATGVMAIAIRNAVKALWPEGFRGVSDQEFDALLMEMVGLGVLRRVNGNHFTFRNPNVLHLMGTAADIDDRLTKIAVEGELKPGFDATTFRGPATEQARAPERSPLTIDQEHQIYAQANGVFVVCGAPLSGLSGMREVFAHRHTVSSVVAVVGTSLSQAEDELSTLRSKAKAGVNVMLVPDESPWTIDWIRKFADALNRRASSTSFVRAVFEAGPVHLWNLATQDELDKLDAGAVVIIKPWADPFLWIWLEDLNMPTHKPLRKAIMDATDGRQGLIMQLYADLDGGPARLPDRIETFRSDLLKPERADAVLRGLGVYNKDAIQGLEVIHELPGESVAELEQFWKSMGPDSLTLKSFLRWAELLSLVRPVGLDRWEVEPFVGHLLLARKA